MIKVERFVSIIHGAAMQTHAQLREGNLKLMDDYFQINVPTEPTPEFEEDEGFDDVKGLKTKDLYQKLEDAKSKGASPSVIADIEDIYDRGQERDNRWEKYTKGTEAYLQKAFYATSMRARMIELDYPDVKNENAPPRKIQVPLIALIPITQSELSEVKFKINLEFSLTEGDDDDGGISVSPSGLGQQNSGALENNTSNSTSQLEITVTPHRGSEGLRLLVEGFERILRAQLPH